MVEEETEINPTVEAEIIQERTTEMTTKITEVVAETIIEIEVGIAETTVEKGGRGRDRSISRERKKKLA